MQSPQDVWKLKRSFHSHGVNGQSLLGGFFTLHVIISWLDIIWISYMCSLGQGWSFQKLRSDQGHINLQDLSAITSCSLAQTADSCCTLRPLYHSQHCSSASCMLSGFDTGALQWKHQADLLYLCYHPFCCRTLMNWILCTWHYASALAPWHCSCLAWTLVLCWIWGQVDIDQVFLFLCG